MNNITRSWVMVMNYHRLMILSDAGNEKGV